MNLWITSGFRVRATQRRVPVRAGRKKARKFSAVSRHGKIICATVVFTASLLRSFREAMFSFSMFSGSVPRPVLRVQPENAHGPGANPEAVHQIWSADQRLSASISFGSTLWTSPTMPRSATAKIGASGSLLMAMMFLEPFIPTRCWVAPEMPAAM